MRQSQFFPIAVISCLSMVAAGAITTIEGIHSRLVRAQDSICQARRSSRSGSPPLLLNLVSDRLPTELDKCTPAKPTTQNPKQALAITEAPVQNAGFILYGDTNRDGAIDIKDYKDRDKWSWSFGALMLFNNDDDDLKGSPDWQDAQVNGDRDVTDLALVRLEVSQKFVGSKLFIAADPKALPYINVFQRTQQGWLPVDLAGEKPITFSRHILLGVEAKQFADRNWNGLVTLHATTEKKEVKLASDTIQMRVSPWIVSPNTAPVTELYVSDFGAANGEFVAALKQGVESTGAKLNAIPEATPWMQDMMEIGYVQWVNQSALQTFNVVLNGNRGMAEDYYAQSLLSSDFGWFQVGNARELDPANEWADWYGNLEVTPPLPGYPLGRIYYGHAGDITLNPEVLDFLKAQEIQGPPVDIDTSWLGIGHVDEIISFIPTPSGKYLMMIVSPEEGVNLLQELNNKGYGTQQINRGLSIEMTVEEALNNKEFIEKNLQLQRDKINPIIAKLKKEFQLTDDEIIQIPALFNEGGSSWWPNMVNSVVVNGKLMVSNPQGAIIEGTDYTQQTFRHRVAASGLQVYFLNDMEYQELRGNTHCATNTRRVGIKTPFWRALPYHLRF